MKIRFCTTRLATTLIYILPTSIRSRAVRAMEAFADGGRFPLFTAAAAVLASFIFCFRSLFSCFLPPGRGEDTIVVMCCFTKQRGPN